MNWAHNHQKPITVEESVIISRLERLGIKQPPYLSRDGLQAWIDANRHLVEDKKPDDPAIGV